MKSEIIRVEHVPFMGADLMAAQDSEGNIWAGVRWICDGIGLSKGQMQNERAKIHKDKVLKQGERNLVLPSAGGEQEVLCIRIDFLPLWLAKINITPTMEAETPELAANLENYQLKAKDVLAAAFLPKEYTAPKSAMEMLRLQSQALFELDDKVNMLADKVDNQMTIDHGQQRTLQKAINHRVYARAAEVFAPDSFKEHTPPFFRALHHDLKDRFGVASYRDIRPADYRDAAAYIDNWIEPASLRHLDETEVPT